MSKKPYIIQKDSPNLIIVPVNTEIGHEPVAKKTKLDNNSLNKLPVQNCDNSALVNNASLKVKPGASCRNNSVLIDVRKAKRQPSSWAANFLQSIGGSASNTSRSYTNLATKLSLTRTENTQPNATETSTQLKLTSKPAVVREPTQLKFNKSTQPIFKEVNQPKPNKEATQPKANLNQPKLNKETTQPKANQELLQIKSKIELTLLKGNKELLRRKINKEDAVRHSYREITDSKTNKEGSQIKLNKTNQSEINANKKATQSKASKEALQIKLNKERSQLKVCKEIKQKSKNEDTQTVLDLYNHCKEITKQKPYKTSETSVKKEDTRPKFCGETTQTNTNKETTPSKVKKTIQPSLSTESSKLKASKKLAYKEALQLKSNKKSSKQIDHKKISKDITYKESSKRIKSKETAQISHIKPPTTSRHQKDDRLSLKSFRVNAKSGVEPSTNKKIKCENSKSSYREEIKGISPIKSVVTKILKNNKMQNQEKLFHTEPDHHLQHSEKLSYNESDADLRTKLKRKVSKDDINIKEESDIINIKKFCSTSNRKGFVPSENLIISFNAESDTEQVIEKKPLVKTKLQKQSSKGKKTKKIKLTINLIVQNADTTDEDDDNIESCNENTDLSFLDDFNIDEIAKSLNDCQSNKAKTSTEIYLNNNTVINENDSMDSGLPINHGKESRHTNDGKKVENSAPKEELLTENNSSNACKNILRNQYSAVTKYIEDKNSVLQLTSKENSPDHQNRADENVDSNIGEVNVKGILTNYKQDHSINSLVEMPIKGSDGNHNYIENKTNISDYVELSGKQKNTAVDLIQIDDNSVELKPKINGCSDDDIIICADISPKEGKSMKQPTQLNAENDELLNATKCSKSLQDSENIQPTNNNHEKHVNHNIEEKLMIQSSDVKTDDASDDQVSKCNKSPEDKELSTVEISQVKGEVIVIEDDDYKIVEVKGQQHLFQNSIVDLTRGVDETCVTKSNKEEKNIVETMKPNTIETDTEPILILETDYDLVIELESSLDSKEVKSGTDSLTNVVKTTEPTENIDKLSNDIESNNNSQNKIENSEVKSTTAENQTQLAKDKNDKVNNSAKPVDNSIVANKEPEAAKQNQAKINSPKSKDVKPKTEAAKPTNANAKKQPTMAKQENNACQAQTVNNDEVLECNDKKLTFKNKSLAKDLLAQSLEVKLQKIHRKNYSVTKLIGKGKFSTVYCCEDGNGCTNAVKVLSAWSTDLNYGKSKEDMLMKLQKDVPKDNLNVVRFFYGFPLNGHWCYVMEYYPRNLHEILSTSKKSLHIDAVQHLSRQLVAAVTILRNNNIIHSDISPRHILLNEAQTRLKLCGFDGAFYFKSQRMLPNVGTSSYRAPELILGYIYADYGIDVWATAAVMYEMATNQKLFPGQFNNDILFKQLCVLNDVPSDMLQQSIFRHKHYAGNAFSRILGPQGQRVLIYQFARTNWITNNLFEVYTKDWAKNRPPVKRNEDREKIDMLSSILHQMFVMHPKYRIPIEFVFANPFIYELFEGYK